MAVNFFQLEAFITVAQCQSYTQAAKLLFTSQSNISRTIQALENELGTELFLKKGNRVIPTEAGLLFLDSSQFLLEEYRRVQNQMGRCAGGSGASPWSLPTASRCWVSSGPWSSTWSSTGRRD